jgi:hypothetical protein
LGRTQQDSRWTGQPLRGRYKDLYRQLDDEWYDYSLRKAVELAGSDGSPARAILFSGLVEMEA